MGREQKWRDQSPGFFVALRGMADHAIKKITIQFVRDGAPPVKPQVVVENAYAESPMYNHLVDMTRRVTAVMSECNWDDSLIDSSAKMDTALLGFTAQLQKIRKQQGEGVAGKMLGAAIDKIEKQDFMQSHPNRDLIIPHWKEALQAHFDLAMHPPKRR